MSQHIDDDFEEFPLSYSIDNAILMHRDAHFGGSFPIMLEYYVNEGKGTSKEFDVARIQELYDLEQKSMKNLSAVMLSGPEAEKVADAKKAYKDLRDIYDVTNPKSPIPKLIADLILAEEADVNAALDAAAAQKSMIVPALIELLRNEHFYDPLFPGYGLAPSLAAQCLGKIGDKRAIISLFESIDSSDFFNEDILLDALHQIGTPAKEFLLKVMHGHPITLDNEQAALALIRFKDDPQVSSACLEQLKKIDLKKNLAFATYLVLGCEALKTPELQQQLREIANWPDTPRTLKQDIEIIAKNFNKE